MNPAELGRPPWSTGRRTLAVAFVMIAGGGLLGLSLYLADVLFLLLNHVRPTPDRLTGIVQHWQRYRHDPQQRPRLQIAIAAPAVVLLVLLPAALVVAARPRRSLHGEARFAHTGELRRAGLLAPHASPAIVVGRRAGRLLGLPGQLSVLLAAPTRSGKGVGVVIPNLLQWPDSVVVLDIKGENHAITAGYRAGLGQSVYAFSPFDEAGRSHRWNPLSAVRPSPLHRVGDLLAMGQVFFPGDVGGSASEAFFSDQARNLFLGLGLLLLESPELPRSLGEMLRQSSGLGRPLKEHLHEQMRLHEAAGRPLSPECCQALQRLLTNSDNTLFSIVATFNAPLLMFADAVVDAATSGDDFDLAAVRQQRLSIYVCIPPHRLASARPLLNLFFSQLVALNTRQLPQQDPRLRVQCLLILDEFTALGRVDVLVNAAAFLAGYNLRLLTVIQAMSQLDAVYGERLARTFATNHGLQVLFAPREQRDAEEYSAMLGYLTARATSHGRSQAAQGLARSSISTHESEQRRALLLPQEMKELGAERLVLIPENCKPVLAQKIRYHRDPPFRDRLLATPPVPALPIPPVAAPPAGQASAAPTPWDQLSPASLGQPLLEALQASAPPGTPAWRHAPRPLEAPPPRVRSFDPR